MKWISVNERLPKYANVVLVFFDLNIVFGYHIADQWNDADNGARLQNNLVTHWRPLPKSPKEKE